MIVVSRKAVHSALWLALSMICLALLYIMQGAVFLGIVQIVVYTGAVMMLFLFVLMLVGVDASDSLVETLRGQRLAAVLAGLGFGLLLISALVRTIDITPVGVTEANAADGGNVQGIARSIFTQYIWAFEVTAALLVTAAVGAMVPGPPRARHPAAVAARAVGGAHPQRPRPAVAARPGSMRGTTPSTPSACSHGPVELTVPRSLTQGGDEE